LTRCRRGPRRRPACSAGTTPGPAAPGRTCCPAARRCRRQRATLPARTRARPRAASGAATPASRAPRARGRAAARRGAARRRRRATAAPRTRPARSCGPSSRATPGGPRRRAGWPTHRPLRRVCLGPCSWKYASTAQRSDWDSGAVLVRGASLLAWGKARSRLPRLWSAACGFHAMCLLPLNGHLKSKAPQYPLAAAAAAAHPKCRCKPLPCSTSSPPLTKTTGTTGRPCRRCRPCPLQC